MKLKKIAGGLAALSLTVAPVLATPALAAPSAGSAARANPASALSVARGARVGNAIHKGSKLSGGVGILAALILAGIIAIPVIDAVKNDNPSSP